MKDVIGDIFVNVEQEKQKGNDDINKKKKLLFATQVPVVFVFVWIFAEYKITIWEF